MPSPAAMFAIGALVLAIWTVGRVVHGIEHVAQAAHHLLLHFWRHPR